MISAGSFVCNVHTGLRTVTKTMCKVYGWIDICRFIVCLVSFLPRETRSAFWKDIQHCKLICCICCLLRLTESRSYVASWEDHFASEAKIWTWIVWMVGKCSTLVFQAAAVCHERIWWLRAVETVSWLWRVEIVCAEHNTITHSFWCAVEHVTSTSDQRDTLQFKTGLEPSIRS